MNLSVLPPKRVLLKLSQRRPRPLFSTSKNLKYDSAVVFPVLFLDLPAPLADAHPGRAFLYPVGDHMRLRGLAIKLQRALWQKGRRVKIDQRQTWSDKTQRMVTMYQLREEVMVEGERKSVTILETYQLVEVVKTLAAMYGGE